MARLKLKLTAKEKEGNKRRRALEESRSARTGSTSNSSPSSSSKSKSKSSSTDSSSASPPRIKRDSKKRHKKRIKTGKKSSRKSEKPISSSHLPRKASGSGLPPSPRQSKSHSSRIESSNARDSVGKRKATGFSKKNRSSSSRSPSPPLHSAPTPRFKGVAVSDPDKEEKSQRSKPVKIHVGKLTRNVTKKHLFELFGKFGTVKSVSNPHDAAGDGFNSAYIEFSTPKEAESAIGQFYFIDGQEITASPIVIKPLMSSPIRMESGRDNLTQRRRQTSPVLTKSHRVGVGASDCSPPSSHVSRSFSFRGEKSTRVQDSGSHGSRSSPPPERRGHKRKRKSSSSSPHDSDNKLHQLSPHVINYLQGDATSPIGTGKRIIAHMCNNAGGWGKGFVAAVSRKWFLPEAEYRKLKAPIDLGRVQFISVTEDLTVANMIAQTSPRDPIPIRYDALRKSLRGVADHALEQGASIHMPKIGTGLSRGNWDQIMEIILEECVNRGIQVYVYLCSSPPPPERRGHKGRCISSFSSPQDSDSKLHQLSRHVIRYLRGDATSPIGTGKRIIAHICNNAGGWGKGFVVAVSRKWFLPEAEYRKLKPPIDLGRVQFVSVEEDITVANMVAQTSPYDPIPIRYDALRKSLRVVADHALELGASIHMPKIGAGLSRGNWDLITEIIVEECVSRRIQVFVYLYE